MLKVYEVESRKGKLTKVVASNKEEVKSYVDKNKSYFSLDMSGHFKVNYLKGDKATVSYDEFENEEIYINGEWDTSSVIAD